MRWRVNHDHVAGATILPVLRRTIVLPQCISMTKPRPGRSACNGHTRKLVEGGPPDEHWQSLDACTATPFLANGSATVRPALVDQFAAAWEQGDVSSVDEFFAGHATACADPEMAVRLIYEEYCLRQESGLDVDTEAFLLRFPQWRSKLQLVLDCHRLVQATGQPVAFPAVGEQLGDFHLLAELGRGAEGRVYLATQPSLSDRPVVVKVVPSLGHEHLTLARLQHTSIVPLYVVQDLAERHLRLLCMPYVGGITLARLLQILADVPVAERTGRHIVDALYRAQQSAPVKLPSAGPALQFLPAATYVQATCWIGACLADALQYAHGRGLVHLDVKPSNILLAGDGQPMLLDFHLAHDSPVGDRDQLDGIGGTPGYMAPEQQLAIRALQRGHAVRTAFDGRSDIYALGVVLHELLGGKFRRATIPCVRRHCAPTARPSRAVWPRSCGAAWRPTRPIDIRTPADWRPIFAAA